MTKRSYPTAGDAVKLVDVWPWASGLIQVGQIGIIDGVVGERRDELQVTWNYSAFRGYHCKGASGWQPPNLDFFKEVLRKHGLEHTWPGPEIVSCSGGPATIFLPSNLLVPTDELAAITFWCWYDYPQAHGGHHYRLAVPLWTWDGKGYS